jgi:N-acetylglucosamine-6-phosphate deacetylase
VNSILIRHADLISPGREISDGALLVGDGIIAGLFTSQDPLPQADVTIDAGGRRVLPGFIDIHAHGAAGHDVCDGTPEALRGIARAKLAEGVTSWLPTTLTQAAGRLEQIVANCGDYIADPSYCRAPAVHLEGPFINRTMAGAQNPDHVRPPDAAELRRLQAIAPTALLSLAPELAGATDLIRAAKDMGITCSAAHTAATHADITAACDAGLTHLTHYGNAMRALHHREIGVVGAGLLDDRLMLELICDFAHLSREMIQLIFKVVPIGRLMLITDSTAASGMPDGEMELGGLPVTVSGGIARLTENGALAGSTLAFNRGLANAAAATGLPLTQLVATTSWNQARSLGLPGLGRIEPGFTADLVILNDDFSVWKTLVGGQQPG